MSQYFEALVDAANGARGNVLPIAPPAFAQEEEVGLVEAETRVDEPQATERPSPIAASREQAPRAAAEPPPGLEGGSPKAADALPIERSQDPVEPEQALAPPPVPDTIERVVERTERHIVHLVEDRPFTPPSPPFPSLEAPAPAPASQGWVGPESRVAPPQPAPETFRREAPAVEIPARELESIEPVIVAAPLDESELLGEIESLPGSAPALSIEIGQIDIRIIPPEAPPSVKAERPAPLAPPISLADYLAERSGR